MTTLVTGASGFVGNAVMRHCLAREEKVRVLVRANSDRRLIDNYQVEVVQGDLSDRDSLEAALNGCDYLYHVAADYRLWSRYPEQLYQSNVDGTRNIMLAALDQKVKRIVYTSSVATLGLHADGSPSDETTPVSLSDMVGDYKRSKYLAEREVESLIIERGLPAVIVNPSTPVGPGDLKPTPTGQMILDAITGKMPAYVDTGLNIVHVDDVAIGHLSAMDKGEIGESYILGAADMTLQEILAYIAKLIEQKPPVVKLPHNLILPIAWVMERIASVTHQPPRVTVSGVQLAKKKMFFSHAKAKDVLDYSPRSAHSALADAVEWFQSPYFSGSSQ